MSQLSKRLAGLSPEQIAYLSRQLKEKGKANQSKRQIPARVEADTCALSYAQQRLWFIHQLDPLSPAYNVPLAVRLTGRLNLHSFQQALTEVARRHESLRTRFFNDEPLQQIQPPPSTWPLPLIDLSGLSSKARDSHARRLIEAEARRPFDLAQGPIMRTHLLRLTPDQHIVLLNMHHIVSDGWSIQVLMQEIVTLYAAFSSGQQSPLADLAVQYADYAEWQRGWLSGAALDEQVNWWAEQLRDAPTVLELPTDYVRPRQPSFKGAIEEVRISAEVVEKLRAISQREGATLFMLLLAAWEVLLWKYSGQEDILIGTPVAGRQQLELEKLVGFFVNTLVVRGRLKDELSFRELLQQTRETVLDAHQHQDLPLEKLVETLPLERSLSHDPLFQVMFGFEQEMRAAPEMQGLKFDFMGAETKIAKFSLTLTLSETKDGIAGALEYATDLFDTITIRRLSRQFETLVEAIAADPDGSLARLPLLSDAEQYELLQEWNDTARHYPLDASLQQLFESQVERAPDSIACVYEDNQITYAELNRRANQLAHRLRKSGVGPEILVGIMVERGLEMLVGVLGIIKAGGGYVPLDANYPPERLAFMMDDTKAPVLLTQSALLDALPEQPASVICLDTDWPTIAEESELNPKVLTKGDTLAYVIYTSGSTGRPKGVAVTHQAIKRLICNTDYVQLDSSSRIAQVSSFSFDAATFEIWGTLLEGGCLIGISKEVALSPQSFTATLKEQAVTELFLTTALFNQIASEVPAGFASLRDLLFGGELVDARWVREVLAKGAPARLLHVYGPTETTTFATWQLVEEVDPEAATVPIGSPLANTTLYILDRHYQPVPIGVAGQLYIGGPGLARGYLARPELTAEKFIPHLYSATEGARLYSTGDRVRYLADGSVEFLGRADDQVKVRGFRIELGEIETMLSTHPSVREAVVLAREDQRGDRRVVAYVTAKQDSTISIPELRAYLQQRLPDYMIPSAFVELEQWPYTPSGKIDRRALPAPAFTESEHEEYQAARTQTEEVLAHIWAEVLKIERVSVTANFFELGGHSLLATQIISRIRQLFHLDIALRALFESPTVAALASEIEAAMRQQSGLSQIPPLLPQLRLDAEPVILSYAQQRLWFIHQLEPLSPAYNVPLAVRLTGELNLEALQQAFTEVVRRHESLRTHFFVDEPLQQIEPVPVVWPLPLIDLSAVPVDVREVQARQVIEGEARRPFDLVAGPVMRTHLLRLTADEHIVLLNMHHIVSDGWSIQVLFQEVVNLYAAFSRGQLSPLPELAVQYADYAQWQRGWLSGEVLDEQINWWSEQLRDAPPVLELPTDYARPRQPTFKGSVVEVRVSEEVVEKLRAVSRKEGATLFMLLLAAWEVLLWKYSGQTDMVIGTPIANRRYMEVEPLIGFFVNTLALRGQVNPEESFSELVRQVRERTLGAYAHQDVPFEKLVEALPVERALDRNPLFQVMFILQNTPKREVEMGELAAEMVSFETKTSQFDLTLTMEESAEDGLMGALTYSTELFSAETGRRIVESYERVLEWISENSGEAVWQAKVVGEEEEEKVVREWNQTSRQWTESEWTESRELLHELIERQVRETPERVAVEYDGEVVSYEELEGRANQLGRYLREQGVRTEVRVGVLVERSIEMVVALLGIMKAGGAYVPLDPQYPRERLEFIIKDAGGTVLVTQEHLLNTFPELEAKAVCLDRDWAEIARESEERFESGVGADNLAYVIYTSGSTGQPKGTQITHRAAANFLYAMLEEPGLTSEDVVLSVTSLSFDPSVLELYLPLMIGARVVIASHEETHDGARLLALISDCQPTLIQTTPARWQLMLEAGWRDRSTSMKILCGGEALSRDLADELLQRVGSLWNVYGPTETTVWSSVIETSNDEGTPPLGRAIGNMQYYILDPYMKPAPIGVAGELYIGGPGLSRGYLNRTQLTAEKFIPHPFSEKPGERLYRSGDVARFLADGTIDFLGRADNQVKIRGFRVELEEIETHLRDYAGVREAVVMLREDSPSDKRLVAYLTTSSDEAEPMPSELRVYLQERLPDYMIPSAFVELEQWPYTPSGKIDRRALPEPENSSRVRQQYVPARNAIEEQLVGMWEELLAVQPIGVQDSFFELGGHSLLVVRLMSRIKRVMGKSLPLAAIFEGGTIEQLARRINREDALADWSPLVRLQAGGSERPFFLVHPVGGNVLSYGVLVNHLGRERGYYGLQAHGLMEGQSPLKRLDEMATEYLAALRTVQPEGPYLLGGWSMGGVVAFEMARQLTAQEQQVELLALIDSRLPLKERGAEDTAALLFEFALDLGLSPDSIKVSRDDFLRLTPDEQLNSAFTLAKELKALPLESSFGQFQRLFDVFKHNRRAMQEYMPGQYQGRITLLQASEPVMMSGEEGHDDPLRQSAQGNGRATTEEIFRGWNELAAEGVESRLVPGTHYTIMREPNVERLAEHLQSYIRNGR